MMMIMMMIKKTRQRVSYLSRPQLLAMEEAKLVALYNDLKGGYKGKSVGLGAGAARRVVEDTTLPQNALYRSFVRAGAYDPATDTVARDFRGKKLKLGAEDEDGGYTATPAAEPQHAENPAAGARKGKKREREAPVEEDAGEAAAPPGEQGSMERAVDVRDPPGSAAEEETAVTRPRFRLKKAIVALLQAAPESRMKARKLTRAAAAEVVAARAVPTDAATGAVEEALVKLLQREILVRQGKYVVLSNS